MPLIIPTYASLMQAKINAQSYQGHAFNGPMLPVFCLAVATGVIQTSLIVKGQLTPPVLMGVTTGMGILCSSSAIADGIYSKAVELFGQAGPALRQFCQAIGEATQMHFASATLISDSNGTALFPMFRSVIPAMKSAIITAAPNFIGDRWPDFAEAIATGICSGIASTGLGTLAGAVSGPTGTGIVTIL